MSQMGCEMVIMITGGSGSGKSAYAEDYIVKMHEDKTKILEDKIKMLEDRRDNEEERQYVGDSDLYYVATMKVYDSEGKERVVKHRKQREGKGFTTIEQSINLSECVKYMAEKKDDNYALIECMSNLVANEMFTSTGAKNEEEVSAKVMDDFYKVQKKVGIIVVVTNNIFEDGCEYNEETKAYIRSLGKINKELAKISDKVIEVVAGIPIQIK